MKKYKVVLISCISLLMSSCCYAIENYSLEEYKALIEKSGIGNSDLEIDRPDYFLPNRTFLNDYEFLRGEYYFFEPSVFSDCCKDFWDLPAKSLLILYYECDIYIKAKEIMVNSIPVYKNKVYKYNDYTFYINENFMDSFPEKTLPTIPDWFTMACYNDEKNMICFLGFCNSFPKLDEKYYNDFEGNFTDFIDLYYKEWFDFNK